MTEVAHDIQQQVSRFITSDLSLVNSYDTWHGTAHVHIYTCTMYNVHIHLYVSIHVGIKNVWKQMLKISQGRVRDRGVTWFPELVDKSQCIHHAMTVCVYAMC